MLYYLFGITGAESPLPKAPPLTIERITCGGLAALVERVPASEYAPAALQERLASLEWVAGAARRHESVLERAMAGGAVIPARLCTLFDDAEAVARSLEDGRYRFSATLDFLSGRFEWGVKVFCDEGRLDAALCEDDPELLWLARSARSASPGLAYVLEKKRDARRAQLREERVADVTSALLDEISARTVALREKPCLSAELTGRSEPMVLNAAVLATRTDWEEVVGVVSDLAEDAPDGFSFETSGPWPAYSFADETGPEDAAPSSRHAAPLLALGGAP